MEERIYLYTTFFGFSDRRKWSDHFFGVQITDCVSMFPLLPEPELFLLSSTILALPPKPANKQDSQVACPWLVAVAFHNDPQKQKEFFHK